MTPLPKIHQWHRISGLFALTLPSARNALTYLLGFSPLLCSRLCSNVTSLKTFSGTTLLKVAPIHFYPFAMLYFFFYNLSLPDIIMYYIYLFLVCLPHWKVSSMRVDSVHCYISSIQNVSTWHKSVTQKTCTK